MSASAGVGLFITVLRLIRALQGGEGAPDLTETATNLAITGGGLALLVFLLRRDLKAKAKDVKKTSREDALSRLQIDLGNRRVLPLLGVRGQVRPVLVAGTKAHVEKCIKEAEKYYMTLRERGVSGERDCGGGGGSACPWERRGGYGGGCGRAAADSRWIKDAARRGRGLGMGMSQSSRGAASARLDRTKGSCDDGGKGCKPGRT